MTKKLSAHQFKEMYAGLGYDLAELGCIMLNLEPQTFKINEDALYYAKNKKYDWIDGNVAGKTPHVTLLYGLLRKGRELLKPVNEVLGLIEGGEYPKYWPKELTIDHIDFFDSPYDDEPYYCVVAHIKVDKGLQEAHDRLTFLPHIDTFPGYKPHFTLCYIKKNERTRDSLIKSLDKHYAGQTIKTTGINYGGKPK